MANSLDPSVQLLRERLLGDLQALKTQEPFPTVEQMRNLMDRTKRFTELRNLVTNENLHAPHFTEVETKIQIKGVIHGT